MAVVLQVWIPQRASSVALKALQERFPYRPGDWFDQSVTGTHAPTGFHLGIICLADDPDDTQIEYLEAGKCAGLIATYDVSNR
jgi:hypothetical protein